MPKISPHPPAKSSRKKPRPQPQQDEAGVGSGASDAASGAGHSFDHAVFDLAGFCQSEDFFAFGKAFCVFDVDWYIGIVFLQTVFKKRRCNLDL